jgi:hypothetical protein
MGKDMLTFIALFLVFLFAYGIMLQAILTPLSPIDLQSIVSFCTEFWDIGTQS